MIHPLEVSCKYLQQEKDHIPHPNHKEFVDKGGIPVSHYLCIRTMTVSGPDHLMVAPEHCDSRRTCFVQK